ncbi:triose-phosphate isomerase [Benzoatithermus flavus]|uniref:Triosephosphate isomerase n=1 Tax=Benzoatithermus flavus TaxID=3108223 RepID=A0ABU8XK17_9PROT
MVCYLAAGFTAAMDQKMALARPIVFGNWKMHGLRAEAKALAGGLAERVGRPSATLGVFPPATVLAEVAAQLAGTGILVGGQDCHDKPKGAFTGSISAPMLKDAGAVAVIVGHSERRHGLGETDALVRAKVQAALEAGLLAILCIGETEAEWLEGRTLEVLERQLDQSWPQGASAARVVVAYEPVWAIGTGRTPTLDDIGRSHAAIRARLERLASDGDKVAILYGGSVKADNAGAIMAVAGVDGVLVGGASLDPDGFFAIYRAGGGA